MIDFPTIPAFAPTRFQSLAQINSAVRVSEQMAENRVYTDIAKERRGNFDSFDVLRLTRGSQVVDGSASSVSYPQVALQTSPP